MDLTPDMAAPVPLQNDPNPPVANNGPNDSAIQIAAQSALPSFANGVAVSVKQGVVYLKGKLITEANFLQVVSNVFVAPGVTDVNADQLQVQFAVHQPADLRMTAKIIGTLIKMDVLGKDPSAWGIDIETKQGNIYVSGTLATQADKQHVLGVIRCIQGIGTIHERLSIKP